MFGFKKETVPEWASVMKEKEYTLFMSAIDGYFKHTGEQYSIGDGIVSLGENEWECGLFNLIQICAQNKPKEYAGIIEQHFGRLIEVKAFKDKLDPADFEKMKQYVAVRLYDIGYINSAGEDNMIRRPFAGEVYAALVYDFPHAIENIKKSEFEAWGKTEDELFAIGIENIFNNYPMEVAESKFDDEKDDKIFIVETEHFFAPNILFKLEERKELIGKHGAIIGIPTRHVALIYSINDMGVLVALTTFFSLIPRFYTNGPGSLTREIYWYHDGLYEKLDYEPGEKPKFTPSEEFLALLNGGLEQVQK